MKKVGRKPIGEGGRVITTVSLTRALQIEFRARGGSSYLRSILARPAESDQRDDRNLRTGESVGKK